jgi:hypothetical protein
MTNNILISIMKEHSLDQTHLNAFNMLLAQLTSIGVKIEEEDRCMLLLCSLLDSWDHLVMAIGSTTSSFKMEDVVASLLLEEMRRKSSKMVKEALAIKGRSREKFKKKEKKSKSKLEGRSKSPSKKSKVKCWNYGQPGHVRKDCKEEKKKKKGSFDNASSHSDGDAFIATLAT